MYSDANHIGGNQYLQRQTGCSVYTPGIDCCFTRHPVLEPSFLYGGFPCKELWHKLLIHELTPSMDGAYSDMKEILTWNEPLARCYFADNDLIAAGAIRAFREAGKKVPEDIAIVGFDNIPISQILDLTTINVPKEYMGKLSARRLFDRIQDPKLPNIKLAVETFLVDRYSC